jgi:hypothetical protein
MASELHRLLERARERPPYVLTGWSFARLIVRVFVQRYPHDVAGLVLVDASDEDQSWPSVLFQEGSSRVDVRASSAEARSAGTLGTRPLVVTTAALRPSDLPRGLWREHRVLQERLAGLSNNSQHLLATQSDHGIPTEQPQLVAAAVESVVAAVRRDRVLAACEARDKRLGGACIP